MHSGQSILVVGIGGIVWALNVDSLNYQFHCDSPYVNENYKAVAVCDECTCALTQMLFKNSLLYTSYTAAQNAGVSGYRTPRAIHEGSLVLCTEVKDFTHKKRILGTLTEFNNIWAFLITFALLPTAWMCKNIWQIVKPNNAILLNFKIKKRTSYHLLNKILSTSCI